MKIEQASEPNNWQPNRTKKNVTKNKLYSSVNTNYSHHQVSDFLADLHDYLKPNKCFSLWVRSHWKFWNPFRSTDLVHLDEFVCQMSNF